MDRATTSEWKSTPKTDITLRNLDSKPKVPWIFAGVGSRFLVGNFPGIDQNMHETNEGREKREHGVSTCRFLDVYEYINTSWFRKLSFELMVLETIMLYPILHHLTCYRNSMKVSSRRLTLAHRLHSGSWSWRPCKRLACCPKIPKMPGNGWNGFKKHTCSQNHLIFIWKKKRVLCCYVISVSCHIFVLGYWYHNGIEIWVCFSSRYHRPIQSSVCGWNINNLNNSLGTAAPISWDRKTTQSEYLQATTANNMIASQN